MFVLLTLWRECRTGLQKAEKKKKKKKLLFTLCNLFDLRDTPDTHTNKTRTISVIYAPPKDQKETNKNKTNMHHDVFFNTKP
jgi:hypothetical protein